MEISSVMCDDIRYKIYRKLQLFFILAFVTFTKAVQDDLEGQYVFRLYHSFDEGPNPHYHLRGYVTIHSSRNGEATYIQDNILSPDDISSLKKLADEDGLYRLKLTSNTDNLDEADSVYSFTKACAIYQSGLTDEITIALDQSGHPISVGVSAIPPHCTGDAVHDSELRTFNTSINTVNVVTAPVPDTLTYIQRVEQEKAEKARGEQGDNRSFLAKYWIYIIPLVLFLFVTGATGPEGQGGGR